jgi:deoxyhypusine synthase
LSGPPVEPLNLEGNEAVADMIDNVYARSGFNGRRLAEAAQLFSRMISEGATIAMTVAGAMTPIGMSGIFSKLIEMGFVDLIVSTGANIYHDMHRPFEMPMVQGSQHVDDNQLAEDGVARIYDVYIFDDDTLLATDRVIMKAVHSFDTSKPFSTARLHKALGDQVWQMAKHPEKSFTARAAKFDVPIFTSSPGDSGIGLDLILPHLFERQVMLNPLLDVIELSALVRDADKNGVIEIGGGSPKNFYLQTQPALHQILLDKVKGGHDYSIQLTTDSPHWGGLSGATPSEARSWGKLKDAVIDNVVVYSCASLTFPLIAQYALARNEARKPKRLLNRVDEAVEILKEVGRNNEELKRTYAGYCKIG